MISSMLNNEHEEQITRNTKVIKSLLECVCFCAKQGLPFRGHRNDYTVIESDNKGIFFVNWFSSGLRLMKCCKIT